MLSTRFTELTGCKVPIQQAAIGSLAANPRLAVAVADAGALGMVAVTGFAPSRISTLLQEVRSRTSGFFGTNFIIDEPFYPDLKELREPVEAACKLSRIVEFFYRKPDPWLVDQVHEHGALASWQVGSKSEAVAAAKAGCDMIIAQGIEAGGHVRGKIGLLPLLGEVLDAVDIPVLAAGGIGSGRAVAAVLAAGASGARVGTRFVAAEEAEAHPVYTKALIAAEPEDTMMTETFSAGWPNAPHRVLRSSVEAAKAFKGEVLGQRRLPSTGELVPILRYESLTVNKGATGAVEAMPHWAGESVGRVKKVEPAAAIIRNMSDEAEMLLQKWSKRKSADRLK